MNEKVIEALEVLRSSNDVAEGEKSLEGLKVAELKAVAKELNVHVANANKARIKERLLGSTIGARQRAKAIKDYTPTKREKAPTK